MDVLRRRCDDLDGCLLKYKIHKCGICRKYVNVNGIHQKIKNIILDLMDRGKTQPKQIHVFLSTNQDQFKGFGFPKLAQVKGFVVRFKPTF